MQTFEELNHNSDLSVALGFFDGVHLAHKKVIKSAVDFAEQNGGKSAVITFQDHPCCFFYDVKPEYILSREERVKKFEQLGVDYLYLIKFDEKIAKLDAEGYLREILVKNFAPKSISTGFNHLFGAQKQGNPKFLVSMQQKYGYKYFEISQQTFDENVISSTAIRNYISKGEIENANKMLGYNFFINAQVVDGRHFGAKLGFKTANLNYPEEVIKPPCGVYAVKAGENLGIANFGVHPSIDKAVTPLLEVHLLDFDEDIYGKNLKVEFIKKIRDEKKFASTDELQAQIKKDIAECLKL